MMELDSFYRDTWVEVDLNAIEENILNLKKHIPKKTKIIAVVKANAYGHGYIPVAKAALEAGASMLAVAFLDEALYIRKSGITAPILVMGPARPNDVSIASKWDITLTAISLDWLKEAFLIPLNKRVRIHMKIDSGMGRVGLKNENEVAQAISLFSSSPYLELEGVFTHFATADELNNDYFNHQQKKFRELLSLLPKNLIIHASNSATSLRFPDKSFNAVRFGISMYGLAPSKEVKSILPFPLREAFSLHSKIAHIKKVSKNDKVGYGATYTAQDSEWIATLPIGYADGWIRNLQAASVLVEGEKFSLAGRICMDQLMISLPKYKDINTKVTFIGTQDQERISIDEIASLLNTINYEIPCMISWRVPRIYKKDGEIVKINNFLFPDSCINTMSMRR